jgi:hypothetical protein
MLCFANPFIAVCWTLSLGPFSLIGGTSFQPGNTCRDNPSLIITAFAIARSRHAVFSENLKNMVRGCRIGDEVNVAGGCIGVPLYSG